MSFPKSVTPLPNFLSARAASVAALALALLAPVAIPAQAGDLAAWLERAERMNTANDKVEADVVVRDAAGNTKNLHLSLDPAGEGKLVVGEGLHVRRHQSF